MEINGCPSPFKETREETQLRIDWDNRQVRKDGCLLLFLVVFWIVWAPVTVLATCFLLLARDWFEGCILAIWLIFGWLGTLLIPYTVLARFWREWVEISNEAICYGCEGFLAPRAKRLPLTIILCIFYGHVGEDSFVTLSVYLVPGGSGLVNRHLIGYWLAPALKKELFDRIEKFAQEKQLPLQIDKGYRES